MGSMALIVFFRGINVGGHRAFRPSVLAKELGIYDAVNVGAAGTLVIRKPGLRAKFLAELRRKLPFEATIAFCDGSDLIRLEMDNPFFTIRFRNSQLPAHSVTCRALRHSLGAVRRCSFTPSNLHRARVRRNRGRLPSSRCIESAELTVLVYAPRPFALPIQP
jgi:hypothetical protein